MDAIEASRIIQSARNCAPDRERVYERTPQFQVLLAFNPIPAAFFRLMSPRRRWVILTNFTDVGTES